MNAIWGNMYTCKYYITFLCYLGGEINIIDEGPCTAQWTHSFVKLATILLIQRASLVFTIVWKFHESSWKSAFQEKAKAKVSRTSESANYDVQNRKPAKIH